MYSNAVKITALNDYLNPSEECILPLVKKDDNYEIKLNDKRGELKSFDKGVPYNDKYENNKLKVTNVDKNKKITVGLSDCLSCSGCLTSSEEILLKDDNYFKVIEKMREPDFCVVSISPQTIFMYSSYYNMKSEKVLRKLCYLFRLLGARLVFDLGLAELIALAQSKEEFTSKFNNNSDNSNMTGGGENNRLPIISSHCPGWTLYAEKTLDQDLVDLISKVPSSQVIQGLLVKILLHTINYYKSIYNLNYLKLFNSSSFLNSFSLNTLTPFDTSCDFKNRIISNIKVNNRLDRIYHISVVPCYDKKFEMIRTEYQFNFDLLFHKDDLDKDLNTNSSEDVDKVENEETNRVEPLVDDILSTSDIEKILRVLGLNFYDLKECDPDYLFNYTYYFNKFHSISPISSANFEKNTFQAVDTTHLRNLTRTSLLYAQSGGFAEEIFSHSCLELFRKTVDEECVLVDEDRNVLLRFVIAYGFKNVQNIIKLLKSQNKTCNSQTESQNTNGSEGSFGIDYIELMSCPGGCFNGAGQAIHSNPDDSHLKSHTLDLTDLISRLVPERYFKLFTRRKKVDIQATSSRAFERFLKESRHIHTHDPICQYFSNLLKLVQARLNFKLTLNPHTNTNKNLHW